MHAQSAMFTRHIEDYDRRVLGLLRELWMQAKTADETNALRVRLDSALDERLRLMRMRDEPDFAAKEMAGE